MSKTPECPICLEEYCPVNSCDADGEFDNTFKQNCSCDLISYDRIKELAENRANEANKQYLDILKLDAEHHERALEAEAKVAELEKENSELKGTMDDLEEDVTRLGLVNTALTGVIDRIRGGER
jgi:hypothetical protein